MIRTWVNGRESQSISISERALHYGDGLFETLRLEQGRLQFWSQHCQRLMLGVERLRLNLDLSRLEQELEAFCAGVEAGVVKIIISRGEGGRGYRYAPGMSATRVLMLSELPAYPPAHYEQGIRLRFCDTRMADTSPLAGLKHLNRLEQVLARNEWQDEVEEGLMQDMQGRVVEGTMSNLFAIKDGALITPPLCGNGVRGVIRDIIIGCAAGQGASLREQDIDRAEVEQADELFVCNSVIGIWPVRQLGERVYTAPGAVTRQCMQWLEQSKQEQ